MKLSACLTINQRETPVLDAMFGSLRAQPFDEMVIVLDRSPHLIIECCRDYWAGDKRIVFTGIGGEPGWRSPVPAWNRAFETLTGTHLFAFSSEMVHAPQNIEVAKHMLARHPGAAIFGKASCSCGPKGQEVNWGDGTTPGNLLVDAAHPRPLGFIWAGPIASVRQIGGMDTEFAKGLWYDDDDFFYRLWQSGLNFIFTDEINGVHLHHERPVLTTPEGQALIDRNARYMLKTWGTLRPISGVPKLAFYQPGLAQWTHP